MNNLNQGMPFNPNFDPQNNNLGNLSGANPNNFSGLNPNFNPRNNNLGSLNGGHPNNFNGMNPNLQTMAQNNPLGVIQMLAAQIQSNPQIQMNLLNQLQAQNFGAPFQPFVGQNPNQMMGMQNLQIFPPSQMLQGSQMMGFPGNPQLGMNNVGPGFGSVAFGQSPVHGPGSMKLEQPTSYNNSVKAQCKPQASGSRQFQGNYIEANRCATSQSSANRGPVRTFHGSGKEPLHNRFQKSQLSDMRGSKGNINQSNRRRGRGQNNRREQRSKPMDFSEAAPKVSVRSLPVNYTKHEIQLWREARKKNFPTRANMNKTTKISNNEDADAKLRRQQLKEVLAKQAELGVEVAEIPPDYLSEPETQVSKRKNEREGTYGGSGDRFNKGRGRGNGRDNRHSKRQKFQNKGASATPLPVKREPSLLEKLLSSDIRRDKSQLLQVFRFMVLNDFFKQWPDKPLEFPIINVKDKGYSEEISDQKECCLVEEMVNESIEDVTFDDNENGSREKIQESEEGEITD
ncbi:homeobox protein 5 isoform X2 [Asparagus officinalis]|uniref:homeobox protein 5 isoform X2 n=1 Tax=Asparagus officinalis TaxID=4686 RepID=UPI00098E23BE|nr:homeobox protein 5 isoform X2 [Asparagus officinalis]